MTTFDPVRSGPLQKRLKLTDSDIVICLSGYDPAKASLIMGKDQQGREVHPLLPTKLPTNTDEEASIGFGSNVSLFGRRIWYWHRNFEFITNDDVIRKLNNNVKDITKELTEAPEKINKEPYLKAAEQLEVIFAALINSDASRKKVTALGVLLHDLYKKLWVEVVLKDDNLISMLEPAIDGTTGQRGQFEEILSGIKESLKMPISEAIDAVIKERIKSSDTITEADITAITEGLAKKFRASKTIEEVNAIKNKMTAAIQGMTTIRQFLAEAQSKDIEVEYLSQLAEKGLFSIIWCDQPEQIFTVVNQIQIAIAEASREKRRESKGQKGSTKGVLAERFLKIKRSDEPTDTLATKDLRDGIELTPSSLVTMKWLFDVPLDPTKQEAVHSYADALYEKSGSEERLTTAEWRGLAKALVVISTYEHLPNEMIEECVLKFFLTRKNSYFDAEKNLINLPLEFLQLIEASQLKESILELLRYHNRVPARGSSDPNGNLMANDVYAVKQAARRLITSIGKTTADDLPSAVKQLKLIKIKPPLEEGKRSVVEKMLVEQLNVLESFCHGLMIALCWNDSVDIHEHWKKLQRLTESISRTSLASSRTKNQSVKVMQLFQDLIEFYDRHTNVHTMPGAFNEILKEQLLQLQGNSCVLTPEEAHRLLEYGTTQLNERDQDKNAEQLQKLKVIAKQILIKAEVHNQKTSPSAKAAHLFLFKYTQYERRLTVNHETAKSLSKTTHPFSCVIITNLKKIINRQNAMYDKILSPKMTIQQSLQIPEINDVDGCVLTSPKTPLEAQTKMAFLETRLNQQLVDSTGCQDGDINLKILVDLVKGVIPGVKLSDQFGEIFEDHGLTLVRDFIYPYVICEHVLRAPVGQESLFSMRPASAKELAALVPDKTQQIRLLIGLIQGMDTVLSGGVVRAESQVNMLQKCSEAVSGNKTVMIQAKPGSGKSTMVRLFGTAFPIGESNLTAIIHVAPFVQSEPSWIPLKSFKDLSVSGKGPLHFSITAIDFERLLKETPSEETHELLINSLFVNDEYDHPDYRNVHAQLASLGCRRHVNISATGSVLQMENRIKHWHSKIATLTTRIKETPKEVYEERVFETKEGRRLIAAYTKKIDEMLAYKTSLTSKMEAEFAQRSVEINPDFGRKEATLKEIFSEIMNLDERMSGSFLVEMPGERETTGEFYKNLIGQPKLPVTLLCREIADSGIGVLRAHLFLPATKMWQTMPFDDYKTFHRTLKNKPRVICLYGKDATGGDFEEFSNMQQALSSPFSLASHMDFPDSYQHLPLTKTLKGASSTAITKEGEIGVGRLNTQYLIFPDELVGFHQAYQHLSRLRRSEGNPSLLPPVKIYIAKKVFDRIRKETAHGTKQAFLSLAHAIASKEEVAAEEMRLSDKVRRKASSALLLLLKQQITAWMEMISKATSLLVTHPWMMRLYTDIEEVSKEKVKAALPFINDKTNLKETSDKLALELWDSYTPPTTFISHKLQREVQIARGIFLLHELYFSQEKSFQSSITDLAQDISKRGELLPFAIVWPKFLAEHVLKEPLIDEVAELILKRLRSPLGDAEHERLGNRRLRAGVVEREMKQTSPGTFGILRILTAWDAPTMTNSLIGFRKDRLDRYKERAEQVLIDQQLRESIIKVKERGVASGTKGLQMGGPNEAAIKEISARMIDYQQQLVETRSSMQPVQIHLMPTGTRTRRFTKVKRRHG